jgi:ABC-type sugar transport system ATPase subunit
MAILVVSSDLEEVMAIADRIVVMAAGRITRSTPAAQTNAGELVRDFGAVPA